jgi:galactose mutarotase-like enzyme
LTASATPPLRDTLQRLTLQSDSLRAVVLPQLGGKIASLTLLPSPGRRGGHLLQGPLKPYLVRTPTLPFDQSDGSGWDECLPSISPCEVAYGEDTAEVTDHGDFWRLPFKVEEHTDEMLRMSATGSSLPLYFERTIELEGNTVLVHYLVRNLSGVALPYLWSAHPLFAIDPGDRIILPHSVEEVTAESSSNGRLGPAGTRHAWPFTANAKTGDALDLTTIGQPTDGVGDKIVTAAPTEGWCALDRLTLGTRLTLRFDPKANPSLGLWLCYGGWPAAVTARKGFAVALEPCTAPFDSLAAAIKQGAEKTLAPGAEDRWQLQLDLTAIDK